MKKKYLYSALLFEITACAGAYLIQYFTSRKMGMLRWVNHLCNSWSKRINPDSMNLVLMVLVSILALALLFFTLKKAASAGFTWFSMMGVALGSVGIYLYWTLRYTRRMMAAYYLVCLVLLLGAMMALGCWTLAVFKRK